MNERKYKIGDKVYPLYSMFSRDINKKDLHYTLPNPCIVTSLLEDSNCYGLYDPIGRYNDGDYYISEDFLFSSQEEAQIEANRQNNL